MNGVIDVGAMGLMAGALGSMLAIVVRFRRSRGLGAQMKWLVYAAVVVSIIGVFVTPLWLSGGVSDDVGMELSIVLTSLMTLGIAVAVTVAVVRYRLYDIDIIINRTLVYGVMTGMVLLIYWLVVERGGRSVRVARQLAASAVGDRAGSRPLPADPCPLAARGQPPSVWPAR